LSNTLKKVWLLQAPDRYFDVVPIFLEAARKFNYFDKFYVATDRTIHAVSPHLPNDCVYIPLEKDFGWSNNIIKALEFVEEDVLFLGCEDHIFIKMDLQNIETCRSAVVSDGAIGCIRLTKKPKIKMVEPEKLYSEIVRPYHYYVSLQPTIWKKNYLESVIKPDESAWSFERNATKRAMRINPPYACVADRTLVNYYNFMKRGGLFRPGYVKYAQENDITLNPDNFYEEWRLKTDKYDFESIHNK